VAAAIFTDSSATVRASPDALILVSPAVDLENDAWARQLMGGDAKEISPLAHVRSGLPPTLVLQGDSDTVTPLGGVQDFAARLRAAGNHCDLHVYTGVGHLFTPAGVPDNGWPQPDPMVRADALRRADDFLTALGFMP